jgi:hypothetical protein
MRGKMNIFNENTDFLRSTNCKLLSKIKEISKNYCGIFKFIIPVVAKHFDHSPRAPCNLTTSLAALDKEY